MKHRELPKSVMAASVLIILAASGCLIWMQSKAGAVDSRPVSVVPETEEGESYVSSAPPKDWVTQVYEWPASLVSSRARRISVSYPVGWTASKLTQNGFQLYPPTQAAAGKFVKKIELLYGDQKESSLEDVIRQNDHYTEIQQIGFHRWAVGEGYGLAAGSPIFLTIHDGLSALVSVYNLHDYGGVYRDIVASIRILE